MQLLRLFSRRGTLAAAGAALVAACSPVPSPDLPADAADSIDATQGTPDAPTAPADAETPRCDPALPFGTPVDVPVISQPRVARSHDGAATLTADERAVVFQSDRRAEGGIVDLWMATRAKRDAPWEKPFLLEGVSTAGDEYYPFLTDDRKTLYYMKQGSTTAGDVFVSVFSSTTQSFPVGDKILALGTDANGAATDDGCPWLATDGSLYFSSTMGGNASELYRATKNGAGEYADVQPIKELSSTFKDIEPVLSPDGRDIYWASTRPRSGTTAEGSYDVWHARRAGSTGAFENPQRLDTVSSTVHADFPSWVSADGCILYVDSANDDGSHSMKIAVKPPAGSPI